MLVGIINDRENYTDKRNFHLKLPNTYESKEDDQIEELFRLKAKPTEQQPDNGIVFIRPRGEINFKRKPRDYVEINGALQARYEEDTKAFAEDIKKLFRNNAKFNNDFPQANIEAYMILLFEIARRLVALKEPRELQVQYDEKIANVKPTNRR